MAVAADPFGHDLLAGLDPVRFARLAGLEPDPWQVAALRSRAPRALWNCCRQSGKSTLAAVLACHRALYAPHSLVLLVSPSERQSKEIFRKCLDVYKAVGRPVGAESETKLWLELDNQSRIVSLPGSERTTRGFSAPALVILDEASRVDRELYEAILPALVLSKGRLLALSTPNGRQGWWFESWEAGGDAWERVKVTAAEVPRLDPEWLAAQRQTMPDGWYRQEFNGEFLEVDDAAFSYEHVMNILSDDVEPRFASGVNNFTEARCPGRHKCDSRAEVASW